MPRSFKFTPAAKEDLADIARYTADKWGVQQALKYASLLDQGFLRIAQGKDISKTILPHNDDVCVCHCEHHYVFYLKQEKEVVVIAVLHERMDLMERLKDRLPSKSSIPFSVASVMAVFVFVSNRDKFSYRSGFCGAFLPVLWS